MYIMPVRRERDIGMSSETTEVMPSHNEYIRFILCMTGSAQHHFAK